MGMKNRLPDKEGVFFVFWLEGQNEHANCKPFPFRVWSPFSLKWFLSFSLFLSFVSHENHYDDYLEGEYDEMRDFDMTLCMRKREREIILMNTQWFAGYWFLLLLSCPVFCDDRFRMKDWKGMQCKWRRWKSTHEYHHQGFTVFSMILSHSSSLIISSTSLLIEVVLSLSLDSSSFVRMRWETETSRFSLTSRICFYRVIAFCFPEFAYFSILSWPYRRKQMSLI